jgi:protein associated with RNAse G/E
MERRKWPDSPHYGTTGVVLGEDEHGVWVGAHPGSAIVMPDGTERTGERHALWCVPHDDWFLMHLWHGHPEVDLYVDICTPPTWSERGVRMEKGGTVELVDVEEFEEHRMALAYPDDLVEWARRAAMDILARVRDLRAPFNAESAAPWLDQLLQAT